MKAPEDWPPPPDDESGYGIHNEDEDEIISDAECRDTLDNFLYRSLDKGYLYLGMDFEHLMQAVQRAIGWYETLHEGDELDYD